MITILLAAYNGAAYLEQQLNSLLEQTQQNFTVYIRDDGSVDRTFSIANEYAQRHTSKFFVEKASENSGDAKHNFFSLMTCIRDDYIMLCDQDDIWLQDKIEVSLEKMRELEALHGKETPLLVHTDLTVVDKELNVISPSFRRAMNADYSRTSLRDQIVQNTLTGCTAMYNRALADLLTGEPHFCVMHDWYLMLVASAFGHIAALDRPTVLYRQHGNNEIGAKDVRTLNYMLDRMLHGTEVREAVRQTYPQALSFLEQYRTRLTSEQAELLEAYTAIPKMGKLGRMRTILRLGTLKNGLARRIAHLLFV